MRRQNMGDGVWRENGELIPEAHTWGIKDSYLHSGEIEEANHIPENEFRSFVHKHCPSLAKQIYELVGLGSSNLEASGSPRAQNMVPRTVHEGMRPGHIRNPGPKRERADLPVAMGDQDHVTIKATEVGQNIPTPEYGPTEEIEMGEYLHDGSDGGGEVKGAVHGPAATNVYEDATTLDPVTENEITGGSSKEALAQAREGAKDALNKDGTVKDEVYADSSKDITNIQSDVAIDQSGSDAKPAKKRTAAKKAAAGSDDAKSDGTPKEGVAEKEGSNRRPVAKKAPAKKAAAKKTVARKTPAKKAAAKKAVEPSASQSAASTAKTEISKS